MEVETGGSKAIPDPAGKNKSYELKPDTCRGMLCPSCRQATLNYNRMLELICPNCGYREPGGAFT